MKIESRHFFLLPGCTPFFSCKVRSLTTVSSAQVTALELAFFNSRKSMVVYYKPGLGWVLRIQIWVRFGLCHPGAWVQLQRNTWKYIIYCITVWLLDIKASPFPGLQEVFQKNWFFSPWIYPKQIFNWNLLCTRYLVLRYNYFKIFSYPWILKKFYESYNKINKRLSLAFLVEKEYCRSKKWDVLKFLVTLMALVLEA